MRSIVLVVLAILFVVGIAPAWAGEAGSPATSTSAVEKCEHGVKKTICTRCNPKLIPVFKAKGDWCAEHHVPESQCARCNPKLAKEGVK